MNAALAEKIRKCNGGIERECGCGLAGGVYLFGSGSLDA